MKFRVVFLYQGRVSVFPWVVLRINFFFVFVNWFTLNGLSFWQEETLPQSLFLGNFSQMIIHLNGSIFTPAMCECQVDFPLLWIKDYPDLT